MTDPRKCSYKREPTTDERDLGVTTTRHLQRLVKQFNEEATKRYRVQAAVPVRTHRARIGDNPNDYTEELGWAKGSRDENGDQPWRLYSIQIRTFSDTGQVSKKVTPLHRVATAHLCRLLTALPDLVDELERKLQQMKNDRVVAEKNLLSALERVQQVEGVTPLSLSSAGLGSS